MSKTIAAETETTESTTDTGTTQGPVRGTAGGVVSHRDELRALVAQIPQREQARLDTIQEGKDIRAFNRQQYAAMVESEADSNRALREADRQLDIAQNARAELLASAPLEERERLDQLKKALAMATMGPELRGPLILQLERAIETSESRMDDTHPSSSEHLHARDDRTRVQETLARVHADIAAAQEAVDAQIERMLAI